MTFSIKRRAKRTVGKKTAASVIFPLLAFVFALLAGLSGSLRRQLEISASDKAETLLSEAAAQAMEAAFSDGGFDSDGIVTLSRASDGTVTSVETAPGAITKLSAFFQSKLRETLSERGKVTIPSGNLTGSAFLSGRGFPISFKTVLSYAAVTNVRSEFISVGINQTLHRVILETRAAVTVLLPGRNVTREIVGSFPAAETVIVGRVPDVVLQPGQ
ncbi:MAG: sporulation protein YunB [Clostridia bacterium]|nr:sporulation protein YunB [Clostridia bacterium]